ncbi:MAG: 6-bladed beta-propeller [Tannerella sp.]|nr:6-bladed beta-propeller [Tannerella sp.]
MKKVIFCIILLFSCSCQNGDEQKLKTVFFDKFSRVPLHEILELSYIKPETTDSCLFGFFDQIATVKDFLLILEDDKVFVFDKKGSYITQINCRGEGPGEYLSLASFFIDEKDGMICLIDDLSKKALFFGLDDFQFVSEMKMPFTASCASFLPDGTVIWNNREYLPEGVCRNDHFVQTDRNMNIAGSFVKKEFISGYLTSSQISIYNVEGNTFACTPFSPVIYRICQNEVSPSFQLSFFDRQFPPGEFLREKSANNASYINALMKSDYVSHFSVGESTHDLCVFYIAGEQRFVGLYDKTNERTYHYTFDDFQTGLQTGNVFTYIASGKVDDYYVMPLLPSELKLKKEDGYVFSEPLDSLINQSREDDNPILFLFRLL